MKDVYDYKAQMYTLHWPKAPETWTERRVRPGAILSSFTDEETCVVKGGSSIIMNAERATDEGRESSIKAITWQ
jgi:hypothetical protein